MLCMKTMNAADKIVNTWVIVWHAFSDVNIIQKFIVEETHSSMLQTKHSNHLAIGYHFWFYSGENHMHELWEYWKLYINKMS